MIYALCEQIFLYAPLLCGAYLSFSLMKIPNLSIESAYFFGALIAGKILLLLPNMGFIILPMTIMMSAVGGALVGVVAALCAEKAKFSHLLSAIITIGLFQGVAQWIIGGTYITLPSVQNPLRFLAFIPGYPELPIVALIALSVIGGFFLLSKTQLGVSCALYGDNTAFLKNYRINQSYVIMAGLALSNALAGVSGYLVAQSNGFVDTTMGVGLTLFCVTSLIIGKSLYPSKKPIEIVIPAFGVFGYFILQALLLQIGFDLRYFSAVQAIIVACLLSFTRYFIHSSYQNLLGI